MRWLTRLLLGIGLVAGLLTVSSPTSHADVCITYDAGTCTYMVVTDDVPGAPCVSDPNPNKPPRSVLCQRSFASATGYWSNSAQAYLVLLPLAWRSGEYGQEAYIGQYLDPDGPIQGHTEGWMPVRPAGPSAAQLAAQLVASMNLAPIVIGIVPDPLPGRVGIIGFPQWMWADNPAENTTGPMTRSITQAGFTVTATATMTHIDWNMGDGTVVTCHNAGTKYEDRYGKTPSPTCGYYYSTQGTFTVTATSYWSIAWTGIGQTGTIPLSFTSTATITMGEIQVLRR